MKDRIQSEVSAIYDKIQREGAQSLKRYNDDLKAIERQTKHSWVFVGLKEAFFWCMCLAILFLISRATFDAWGVELPVVIWQFAYPCSFVPFIGYIIRFIAKTMKGE
jgi:hypothetical protein